MEYKEIENILNRYLEGESTLDEESMLKEYFSRTGLPTEQRELQEMFRYFNEAEKQAAPPFDLSAELNRVIENEWKKETRNCFRHVLYWAGGAAAVLILAIGIYQYQHKPEHIVRDTFKDPKLAYLETKHALLLISRTMNRNSAHLKYLSKIDESFNHLKKVAEIEKVVNSVKK